jgi:hypothetical protein
MRSRPFYKKIYVQIAGLVILSIIIMIVSVIFGIIPTADKPEYSPPLKMQNPGLDDVFFNEKQDLTQVLQENAAAFYHENKTTRNYTGLPENLTEIDAVSDKNAALDNIQTNLTSETLSFEF